uniref:Uncharacterized protein n=1 Tax=Chenopodium quinoa TaxID=63459 RepID=A0A803N9C8_CHEQI
MGDFVSSKNLKLGDTILLSVEDLEELVYKVRIWRDEIELTAEKPSVQGVEVNQTPSFMFHFTKGYIDKPTINVPTPFARAHFGDLEDPCEVKLVLSSTYDATMHIYYDCKGSIVACSIKRGVKEFMDAEGVKLGEKVLVELVQMDPHVLSLRFT